MQGVGLGGGERGHFSCSDLLLILILPLYVTRLLCSHCDVYGVKSFWKCEFLKVFLLEYKAASVSTSKRAACSPPSLPPHQPPPQPAASENFHPNLWILLNKHFLLALTGALCVNTILVNPPICRWCTFAFMMRWLCADDALMMLCWCIDYVKMLVLYCLQYRIHWAVILYELVVKIQIRA